MRCEYHWKAREVKRSVEYSAETLGNRRGKRETNPLSPRMMTFKRVLLREGMVGADRKKKQLTAFCLTSTSTLSFSLGSLPLPSTLFLFLALSLTFCMQPRSLSLSLPLSFNLKEYSAAASCNWNT